MPPGTHTVCLIHHNPPQLVSGRQVVKQAQQVVALGNLLRRDEQDVDGPVAGAGGLEAVHHIPRLCPLL